MPYAQLHPADANGRQLLSDGMLDGTVGEVMADGSTTVFVQSINWPSGQLVGYDHVAQDWIVLGPTLAQVQAQQLAALAGQAAYATAALWPTNTSLTLLLLSALYSQAATGKLANRAAYLEPAIEWGNQLAANLEQAQAAVLAATTAAQAQAVTLAIPPAPALVPTRAGAMAIQS